MHFRLATCTLALITLLLLPPGAFGQDRYISRYDFYSGFAYFESPAINLAERGFHLQFGYKPKTWYAMGFDYSRANATLALIPAYLPKALQTEVTGLLALVPPGYNPEVTTGLVTQTFAAGPTLLFRPHRLVTLLIHPSLGAIREVATPYPNDFLSTLLVGQLVQGPTKLDWTGFYGIGGGVDLNVTRHVGLLMQTDVVYDHLFNDILGHGRWTVRASIGPSFHFGKNLAR